MEKTELDKQAADQQLAYEQSQLTSRYALYGQLTNLIAGQFEESEAIQAAAVGVQTYLALAENN